MLRLMDVVACGFCVLVAIGCGRDERSTAPAAKKSTISDQDLIDAKDTSVVELYDTKAVRQGDIVRFELKYRFKQGFPTKFFQCEIRFPGTKNQAFKPMDAWELKREGTIKDGVQLQELDGVEKIEIKMTESDSPMLAYKLVSNVITTDIEDTTPKQ